MGFGGQIGELAGGVIGEIAATHNEARIGQLLQQWKDRYDQLPSTDRVYSKDVGRSKYNDVREDDKLKSAEMEALNRMMESVRMKGMTDADKQKLMEAKLAAMDYERGSRGATEDSMRRRGMWGSGAQVAGALSAQQGGVDRAYKGDVDTAAYASDRALAALAAAGNYASRLGSRDLEQKDLAAGADDRISQFNAMRGDKSDYYNSGLAHQDALDKAYGLDRQAQAEIGEQERWSQEARQKGRGYGKQAGGLFDSMGSFGGGGGE